MISDSTASTTCSAESGVGLGDNKRARHNGKCEFDGSEINGGESGDDEVKKKSQKTFKSKNSLKSKKTVRFSNFFTFRAKLTFTKLRQAFVKCNIMVTRPIK